MNEQVRQAIREYMARPEPRDEKEAEVRAYEDWAALELLERISDRPFDDSLDVIFDFTVEMLFYSRNDRTRKDRVNSFLIAHQTGIDILAMFEHPKED